MVKMTVTEKVEEMRRIASYLRDDSASSNELYRYCSSLTSSDQTENPIYMGIGLANEAGESLSFPKKAMRGDKSFSDKETVSQYIKELGDVEWYLAGLYRTLGITRGEVQARNLEKLADRLERGVIQGDGDDR